MSFFSNRLDLKSAQFFFNFVYICLQKLLKKHRLNIKENFVFMIYFITFLSDNNDQWRSERGVGGIVRVSPPKGVFVSRKILQIR